MINVYYYTSTMTIDKMSSTMTIDKMSSIYTFDGEIIPFDKYYEEGVPIFRKMTKSEAELSIYRRLEKLNNADVVKIYCVGENYVDIEKINATYYNSIINVKQMISTIVHLKDFLQENGILYIDWKWDNFGSINDCYKLFDFDASGMTNLQTKELDIEPIAGFKYNKAVKAGFTKPIDIDNFAFKEFYDEVMKS